MPLTRDLSRFVADIAFERLPAEVVDAVRTGFADCIAQQVLLDRIHSWSGSRRAN